MRTTRLKGGPHLKIVLSIPLNFIYSKKYLYRALHIAHMLKPVAKSRDIHNSSEEDIHVTLLNSYA